MQLAEAYLTLEAEQSKLEVEMRGLRNLCSERLNEVDYDGKEVEAKLEHLSKQHFEQLQELKSEQDEQERRLAAQYEPEVDRLTKELDGYEDSIQKSE